MNVHAHKLTCGKNPLHSVNADICHNLATLRLLVFVFAIFWASTAHAGWNLVTQSAECSGRVAPAAVALPDDSILLMGGLAFNGEKRDSKQEATPREINYPPQKSGDGSFRRDIWLTLF